MEIHRWPLPSTQKLVWYKTRSDQTQNHRIIRMAHERQSLITIIVFWADWSRILR
jgi:hypothetical protein